ncbi:hypothetical protein C0J52_12494 [Blattella germanica]|nr:hypothetical protein C0J52_12494 [Blattella germanica]
MGRKNKELSSDTRELIVKLYNNGDSFKTFAEKTQNPLSTVKSVIYRLKREKRIQNKPRTGRPKLLMSEKSGQLNEL